MDYDSQFSHSETEQNSGSKESDEYKIIAKLTQDRVLFGEWNPVKLTKTISNVLREVKDVKILCKGSLLIFYRH